MAHFVRIEDNVVIEVIVINDEVVENKSFPESEPLGIAFCKSLYGEDTEWLQTSLEGDFRGIYAFQSTPYNPETGEFYVPGPSVFD